MSYEFKKLSEVEALTEVPEGAKVLAEANGQIVRVPAGATTWDDLGQGGTVETLIVDNATVTFQADSGVAVAPNPFSLDNFISGHEYKIVFNDIEYILTPISIEGVINPVIGNPKFIGFKDNGIPFIIMSVEGTVGVVAEESYVGDNTITIYHYEPKIFPVPNEYLPLASADSPGAIKVYNIKNFQIQKNVMKKIVQEFNDGCAVFLWKGSRVTEVYIDSSNDDLLIRFSDAPARKFCIPGDSDSYNINAGSTYKNSETSVVRLYVHNENNTSSSILVSSDCSSDNASDAYLEIGGAYGTRIYVDGSIGLKSSESNKYFRIRVNDSGTLTATEVTT